jgi:hypothetical protein
MFSSMQQTLRQMEVCAAFADQLLGQLRGAIPNLPTTSGMMACVHIPLCNGYALSVSIPTCSNRNLALTDSVDRITVETALFKGDELIYDRKLGYADVRCHDFNAQAILAEYKRLMALLSEQE